MDEKLHKFTMAVKKAEARNLLGNGFHKQTASERRMQPHPIPNNVLKSYSETTTPLMVGVNGFKRFTGNWPCT